MQTEMSQTGFSFLFFFLHSFLNFGIGGLSIHLENQNGSFQRDREFERISLFFFFFSVLTLELMVACAFCYSDGAAPVLIRRDTDDHANSQVDYK